MPTVGLDISALDPGYKEHAFRGIGRYVKKLKEYFDSHRSELINIKYFDHTCFNAPRVVNSVVDALPAGKNTVKMQLLYPLQLNSRQLADMDYLHFPAHMDAPSWSSRRCIVTVLDLIPLVCKELYRKDRPDWRFKLARWLENRAIKSAELILAISHNTAKDVHRILGVPEERILVTHLGVDDVFFRVPAISKEVVLSKYHIPLNRDFLIYVGGIDQRKNMGFMLEVFRQVVHVYARERQAPPFLVLAGSIKKDRQYPNLCKKISECGCEELVIQAGYVPDGDLVALLKASTAFFFPSLYEGFGLPPLEAMAAGTVVISSNSSAMPEVLGDAALYFDPYDSDSAVRQILAVKDNHTLRESLIARGKDQAAKFTWERTGEATLKAYSSCFKEHQERAGNAAH
ncbi:MAG: glycosyltransferase family 1 protein [Candidatus Dadabacteria bacterium]|nr:MAG: glycosyltransferase family 1 protein [Candidatus Dadabacteria bacterium]